MRRWPSPIRYSTAETAPRKFSESTVGSADERTLWSTATTGEPAAASTLPGVTRMTPSASVPRDPREVAALPAGLVGLLPAAGEDDELEPRAVDALGDPLEELGAERLDVADEHADHVRASAPQALTGEARVVPELVDHRPDPGGGRLGDAVAVVDHLRHRRDGNTGVRRHVSDRHASHGAAMISLRNRYR